MRNPSRRSHRCSWPKPWARWGYVSECAARRRWAYRPAWPCAGLLPHRCHPGENRPDRLHPRVSSQRNSRECAPARAWKE